MASSGKKGRKNKGTVISLQSFLCNDDVPVGTTQVAKNIRNVDGEDSDDGGSVLVCQLPTAPRANRIFDDNSIPHTAPFIAYMTNLPFDVKEDDIYDYFSNNNLISVRLPREDGETGRVRGFGYVEFETRDELINAISIPDPNIKGRRIRIDLSNENEQNSRQRGNRRGYDNSNSENRESTNWRRDGVQKKDNFGFERSYNKDPKSGSSDDNSRSWRMGGNQSNSNVNSSYQRSYENRDRDRDQHTESRSNVAQERPKLNLKPRTLPVPELDIKTETEIESKVVEKTEETTSTTKFTGVSAEKVFGSAKPVDTTARDLEIEQRMAENRRKENLKNEDPEVTDDLKELSIENTEKKPYVETSWRRQDTDEENLKGQDKRGIRPGRRPENTRDNRYKYQDTERSDNYKDSNKDGKRKEVNKPKRDYKVERPLPKATQNQTETVPQSSNKFSGLDETSD